MTITAVMISLRGCVCVPVIVCVCVCVCVCVVGVCAGCFVVFQVKKWALCYRMDIRHKGMNTSNGCEGWHSHLKNQLLHRRATRGVTELLNLLLRCLDRQSYEMEVTTLLQLVTANSSLERASKDRAIRMLEKNKDMVTEPVPGKYLVFSERDASVVYEVALLSEEHEDWWCSCPNHHQKQLRCKHIW